MASIAHIGEINASEMKETNAGLVARKEWEKIPARFSSVQLGEFVVMPNHFHGIIYIQPSPDGLTQNDFPRVVARLIETDQFDDSLLASPLPRTKTPQPTNPPRRNDPTLGIIIAAYKSTTARIINGLRRTPGCTVWQRNYYEHIIRNEKEEERIAQYIQENISNWDEDDENSNRFV
jgi:putative transposase